VERYILSETKPARAKTLITPRRRALDLATLVRQDQRFAKNPDFV